MSTLEDLKSKAQAAIDDRAEWLIRNARTILDNPEPGFHEIKTSRFVSEKMSELGIDHQSGIALTGLKGVVQGGKPGPTIAIIGELDSLRVLDHPHTDPDTGAAHACGHHCQTPMMLGAAVGLMLPEVLENLAGSIAFIAVPAEEFIDVEYRWGLYKEGKLGLMSGKQEFIRLGAFDDVDMAMLVHTASESQESTKFALGGTSNGHVVKFVKFIGRAAHAGAAPHMGINALQAAMVALNALNATRETLRNEDNIRLHGILTQGGVSVNSIPADVRYEGRVRGRTAEAIADGQPVRAVLLDQRGTGEPPLGTLVMPNTLSLIRGGPNAEKAKSVMRFLLSDTVLEMLAESCAQAPLKSGLDLPSKVIRLDDVVPMSIDYAAVAERLEALMPALKEWLDQS